MTATHTTDWDRDAALTTARLLLEIKAVNFRPEEPYTFTSGWKSPVYIDCRRIIYFPRARAKIMDLAVQKIDRHVGYETIEAVAGGETAGRAIDAVGHQAVVAGFQIGQQRHGDGGETGRDDLAACAAFDLGDHVLERVMGRPTHGAVHHLLLKTVAGCGLAPGHVLIEHG